MGKIIVTIVLVVVAVLLVLVMVWGMGFLSAVSCLPRPATLGCVGVNFGPFHSGRLPRNAEQGLSVERPAADIRGVSLDFVAERIVIVPAEGNTVRVEQTSETDIPEEDIMRFGVVNGELVAQSGRLGTMNTFAGIRQSSVITLYLPEDFAHAVSCGTTAGDISAEGIAAKRLTADSASGNITIDAARADDISADTVSGRVLVTDTECDTLSVSAVSGGSSVEGAVCRSAEMDTVSGGVIFKGSAEVFDADSVSGGVTVELAGARDISADTTSAAIHIICADTTNLESVDADAISGAVTIELPENDGFEVDFDTVSGYLNSDFPLTDGVYGNGWTDVSVDSASGGLRIVKR